MAIPFETGFQISIYSSIFFLRNSLVIMTIIVSSRRGIASALLKNSADKVVVIDKNADALAQFCSEHGNAIGLNHSSQRRQTVAFGEWSSMRAFE